MIFKPKYGTCIKMTPLLEFISIDMSIFGHSLSWLTTITSVFCFFLIFLLSSPTATMSNKCYKSSFYFCFLLQQWIMKVASLLFIFESNSASSLSHVFLRCAPLLWFPGINLSRFRIIISQYREKRSGESKHPFLASSFIFFFYMSWGYVPRNSRCCCLFPEHIFDHS